MASNGQPPTLRDPTRPKNKTDQSVLQIFTLDLRTKTFGQSLLMALSERLVLSWSVGRRFSSCQVPKLLCNFWQIVSVTGVCWDAFSLDLSLDEFAAFGKSHDLWIYLCTSDTTVCLKTFLASAVPVIYQIVPGISSECDLIERVKLGKWFQKIAHKKTQKKTNCKHGANWSDFTWT